MWIYRCVHPPLCTGELASSGAREDVSGGGNEGQLVHLLSKHY